MRTLGLPATGKVLAPAHIVHLYQHGKELLDISARFCAAGLTEGDYCLWVTTPPWTAELALHELVTHLPSAETYRATGQLEFASHEKWYRAGGTMEPETILARGAARITEAHHRGWQRARACGEPFRRADEAEWAQVLRYEQALHRMMVSSELLVLCSYRAGRIPHASATDLLRAHHAVLTRDHTGWRYAPSLSGERPDES